MTSPFSDELISAYLDGELTAEERARVEKQLREDAELRRMCDELRALRFTLQSMPVAQPATDLTDRVMRQAQRRMLGGAEEAAVTTTAAAISTAGAETDRQSLAGKEEPEAAMVLRHWRVIGGVVASLAALLLLALWLPGLQPRDRVLATPRQAPTSAPATVMENGRHELLITTERLSEDQDDLRLPYAAPSDLRYRRSEAADSAPEPDTAAAGESSEYFDSAALGVEAQQRADRDQDKSAPSRAFGAPARPLNEARSGDEKSPESEAVSDPKEAFGLPDPAAGPPAADSLADPSDNSRDSLSPSRGREAEDAAPMAAGMESPPPAPTARPQGGAAPQSPLVTGSERDDDARESGQSTPETPQGPLVGAATIADGEMESRQAVTQQLLSEFDKNQVLLLQVSMPIAGRQDAAWLFGERMSRMLRLGDGVVQEEASQEPAVNLYVSPKEDAESPAPGRDLVQPLQEVILVEGSPEQIRASLIRLVAQPEVHVVSTNGSQKQLRDLNFAMEELSPKRRFAKGARTAGDAQKDMSSNGLSSGELMGGGMGYGGIGGQEGSGEFGGQGGYPGMGSGSLSPPPADVPSKTLAGVGTQSGEDAGAAIQGTAEDLGGKAKRKLKLEQAQTADLKKNLRQGEGQTDRDRQDEGRKFPGMRGAIPEKTAPATGARLSDGAVDSRSMSRGAGSKPSNADPSSPSADLPALESQKLGRAASTAEEQDVREVVTYLFRVKAETASPAPAESAAPAEPAKQQ